jgi:Carboxylesterase family
MQAAAKQGVKQYGYLFSQHNPLEEAALGGQSTFYHLQAPLLTTPPSPTLCLFPRPLHTNNDRRPAVPHGAEIPYIFGNTPDPSPEGQELKTIMMDYWISFTVSSDPNDGKGIERPEWPQYTNSSQVCAFSFSFLPVI